MNTQNTLHEMYVDIINRIEGVRDDVYDVKRVADSVKNDAHTTKNTVARLELVIGGDDGHKGLVGRVVELEKTNVANTTEKKIYGKLQLLAAGGLGGMLAKLTDYAVSTWWKA